MSELKKVAQVGIVGAGPTGLMMALLLTKLGISIRIFDKNEHEVQESRAFVLQARSLEVFQSIGLIDELLKRGVIASGVQAYVNGKEVAEINFDDIGRDDTPFPFLFMLPQAETEIILIDALRSLDINIERGMTVKNCINNETNATLIIQTKNNIEEHLTFDYVIGADGAHSVVRQSLKLPFIGDAYEQRFLLADCKIEWSLDYDHVKLFMHGKSLGIFLPLKDHTLSRIITIDYDTSPKPDQSLVTASYNIDIEEIEKSFKAATNLKTELTNPIWMSRYRVHHRSVNEYRRGPVFLAGDAAHIHSPAGGQGMNTGIQDAYNLAWKLALVLNHQAPDSLLDTYQLERWPIGQELLKTTDKIFGYAASKNIFIIWLRNIFFPIFTKFLSLKQIRARAFEFISELGIYYSENPYLYSHTSAKKNVSAGHRAPNAQLTYDKDLFSLINNYKFHLLAICKKSLTKPEVIEILNHLDAIKSEINLDINIHFLTHTLYGQDDRITAIQQSEIFVRYQMTDKTPKCLLVIRPDGYIAFRTNEFAFHTLKDYLLRYQS